VPEIFLVPSLAPSENFNGHSMTGELLRVMVCPPVNAGWGDERKAEALRHSSNTKFYPSCCAKREPK